MKKRIAIFDFDGTLFDTCRANYEAYKAAFIKIEKCFEYSFDEFKEKCFGRHYKSFLNEMSGLTNEEIERIHDTKCAIYPEYAEKYVAENEALFSILQSMKESCYIVLFTTASRKSIEFLLNRNNRKELFDYILTGEDVEDPKPAKEGYYRILDKYELNEKDAVFFDDSEEAIDAAADIGIQAYKVIWNN